MWADSGNVSVLKLVQFADGIGLGHEEKWVSRMTATPGLMTGGVCTRKGKLCFSPSSVGMVPTLNTWEGGKCSQHSTFIQVQLTRFCPQSSPSQSVDGWT